MSWSDWNWGALPEIIGGFLFVIGLVVVGDRVLGGGPSEQEIEATKRWRKERGEEAGD